MLPKIDVPVYDVNLPLLKKKVRYRPFLVKEEKILLMAMESGDEKTVFDSIKQIVNNCCLDDIDVNNLPIPDLEFFFLNLRARSVGEISELQYKCNNTIKNEEGEEKTCGNVVPIEIKLLDIKPEIPKEHNNKIEFNEKMGIVMKYPNFQIIEKSESLKKDSEIEKLMFLISECVDYVYDEETVYYKKDIDPKELNDFIDSMSREQFAKIQKFFETMPKMTHKLNFKCAKCGYNENIEIQGLQNFFV